VAALKAKDRGRKTVQKTPDKRTTQPQRSQVKKKLSNIKISKTRDVKKVSVKSAALQNGTAVKRKRGVSKKAPAAKKAKLMIGKTSVDKKKSTNKVKNVIATTKKPKAGMSNGPTNNLKVSANNVEVRRPPKFSYVVDGLLAGMGRPTQHGHVQFLCDNGFKYLITLTLRKPRTLCEYPGEGIQWIHIPIMDERPPTLEQISQFVSLIEKAKTEKKKIGVHCAWGRGRTGTMCACYLAATKNLTLDGAIDEIRMLRPGSIDTEMQRNAIKGYVEFLRGKKTV